MFRAEAEDHILFPSSYANLLSNIVPARGLYLALSTGYPSLPMPLLICFFRLMLEN